MFYAACAHEMCIRDSDTIEVYVKALDPENHKVSLGYKKAEDNPWEKLKNEYPIGSVFTAPVVSITKFGAFVRILPCLLYTSRCV